MEKNVKEDSETPEINKNNTSQALKNNPCMKLNTSRKNLLEVFPNQIFIRKTQSNGDLSNIFKQETIGHQSIEIPEIKQYFHIVKPKTSFRQKMHSYSSLELASTVGSQVQILNDSISSSYSGYKSGKERPKNPVVQKLMTSSKAKNKNSVGGFRTPAFYLDAIPPNISPEQTFLYNELSIVKEENTKLKEKLREYKREAKRNKKKSRPRSSFARSKGVNEKCLKISSTKIKELKKLVGLK